MEETKTIAISAELYFRLRKYCDERGIRFRDFVEDALDAAPHREEEIDLISDAQQKVETVDQARNRSYRRGFWDGFYVSFFAMQGRMDLYLKRTPESLGIIHDIFQVSDDRQMQLFDTF